VPHVRLLVANSGSAAAAGAAPAAAPAGAPSAVESAKAAGLRYVSDDQAGIRRVSTGKGFRYVSPDGHPVRDPDVLRRIRSLAIPPAWRDVWICPDPRGHIQAVGVDQAGRRQYRYHDVWRAKRDAAKFDHVLEVARRLPALREARAQ